ncbi:MAG TPA: hypothetical protein VGX37_13085 [Allosphingosinicella sp.]|jgi:predicted secreted protein|nr:hypothetical protein [Allosphingosinicella sp.]
MKALTVVISALFLAAPMLAQASETPEADTNSSTARTEQSTAPTEAQGQDDPDRRICRRIEENTGSRTSGRRVCLTAEQWRNYNARF